MHQRSVMHFSVISSSPLLTFFHSFDVWNHWSVTYFPVCVAWVLFLLTAGKRCSKGRVAPIALLPACSTESLVSRQMELKGSECAELLAGSRCHTCWPCYSMHTFKLNAKQQSLQQQMLHLGPGRGFCFLHLPVLLVSFHVLVITFDFSFLPVLFDPFLIENKRRWSSPMGGRNSLGWGMAFVWKAFHIWLHECFNLEHLILANCLTKSLLKTSCVLNVQIYLLFYFLKKMSSMKNLSSLHLWWFCCLVTKAFLVSGFHSLCRNSLCLVHLLCNHCPTKVLISLPSLSSPSSQSPDSSTNQRKSMVYFSARYLSRRDSIISLWVASFSTEKQQLLLTFFVGRAPACLQTALD